MFFSSKVSHSVNPPCQLSHFAIPYLEVTMCDLKFIPTDDVSQWPSAAPPGHSGGWIGHSGPDPGTEA